MKAAATNFGCTIRRGAQAARLFCRAAGPAVVLRHPLVSSKWLQAGRSSRNASGEPPEATGGPPVLPGLMCAESGMLLLEVTLAVLIFSLAAVSFAVALNESLDAFHDIRRESGIRIQLQSALAEATGQKLVVGREKLQLGDGQTVYQKNVTLLDLRNRDKQPLANLYRVVVTAEWPEGQRKMQREASQYVYQN